MHKSILILLLILKGFSVKTQNDSSEITNTKKKILVSSYTALSVGSGVILYQAWYKDYNTGKFHFFNDNMEWLQMDKMGHCYSTYWSGAFAYGTCRWAGFNEKKSIWLGGFAGSIYMTIIECMDGFSDGWGFSGGDMIANGAGSMVFISQQLLWKEQRIRPKFSFHRSSWATYRPELLGNGMPSELLKDYNGQTYWFSLSLSSFFKQNTTKLPKWLCLSLGYGANGMISGENNYVIVKSNGELIGNNRYRRYFLSLDADLSKIECKKKWLKAVLKSINCIKIPFPSIEWNKQTGWKSYPIYF